jgi:hypothetical protein
MKADRLASTALLLCVSTFSGSLSWAETVSPTPRPIYSFNQSPLIQIFGLPALGESRVLSPDESTMAVHLQIASQFTGASSSSEALSLDGETRRLTLHWRQGLPGNREWGFELPLMSHSGGVLDKSIEEFHDIFGMPQNGRTDLPRNRIDYRYTRQGVDLVNLNRAVSGPGDVRLFAGKPVTLDTRSSGYTAVWRVSLKLPTGDDAKLLGSGSTDLAGWLSAATTRPPDKWNLYGGGGLLLISEGNVMPAQQRHVVAFGTFGISQKFFSRVTINAQLDSHSPFYNDSGLRQLGEYAIAGMLGLDWEFARRKFLAFSISEDLVVGASPDVTFNLSLTLPL